MSLNSHLKSVYQVDAFTSEAFKGNPAGVVITDKSMDTGFMQEFAAEMNLSETAYVSEGIDCFNIRFFTPFSEVPLCGHASMAAAHVLFEKGIVKSDSRIQFKTPKYDIAFTKLKNVLQMEFPIYSLQQIDIPGDFTEITGFSPSELYKSDHGWHLAYFSDQVDVYRVHPHFHHMRHSDFGHMIVTAKGVKTDEYDFVYRCFAPSLGIDEDPVTGSAQCALAPFWKIKTGKKVFQSFQASKRSGKLETSFIDDETIQIKGSAVTIFEGKILI